MIKDETLREVILRVDRDMAIRLLANSDRLTEQFTEDEFMEQVTFGLFDKQEYRLRTRIFRAIYRKAKRARVSLAWIAIRGIALFSSLLIFFIAFFARDLFIMNAAGILALLLQADRNSEGETEIQINLNQTKPNQPKPTPLMKGK